MAIYYSIGFLILFFLCLVAEFFVPSAGLIGVIAFVAAAVAIMSAFGYSTFAGTTVSAIVLISTPLILFFMIRLWPHTPIGRMILNRKPGERFDRKTHTLSDGTPISDLVGQIGVAQTDLLPSGRVLIDGRKLDAVSIGMPIDVGTRVVVIKIVSRKIQVRIAGDDEATGNPLDATTSGDAKSETLESFDLDTLE
ncbi:MAG: NfeD family protein [Pirellulaceae bacterium]